MTSTVRWKLLPTKLHSQMEQAGAEAARSYMEETGNNNLYVIYEAMVAAAPSAPQGAVADAEFFRKALDLIGAGLIVANGSENTDAIRMEIHALQERDLDQLGLLIECKETLTNMAIIEKRHGLYSAEASIRDLLARIHKTAIAPITEGKQPPALDRGDDLDDSLHDLASSACQEALSFGLNEDVFLRFARTVRQRVSAHLMSVHFRPGDDAA